MSKFSLSRRLVAEFLGTAFLVAAVLGSGIMAERLAGGNVALALLANTLATVFALFTLIVTFGGISGGHFNPAVSVCGALERGLSWSEAATYSVAQITGGALGAVTANVMFGLPPVSLSTHVRTGPSICLSESVATFGLLATIWGCGRLRSEMTALAVAAYIGAAYWFTASTSFANPAVTLARTLSDTFAGIRPADAPAFIAVQLVGALAATALFSWLIPGARERAKDVVVPHQG